MKSSPRNLSLIKTVWKILNISLMGPRWEVLTTLRQKNITSKILTPKKISLRRRCMKRKLDWMTTWVCFHLTLQLNHAAPPLNLTIISDIPPSRDIHGNPLQTSRAEEIGLIWVSTDTEWLKVWLKISEDKYLNVHRSDDWLKCLKHYFPLLLIGLTRPEHQFGGNCESTTQSMDQWGSSCARFVFSIISSTLFYPQIAST